MGGLQLVLKKQKSVENMLSLFRIGVSSSDLEKCSIASLK